jgi:hypothetical protein
MRMRRLHLTFAALCNPYRLVWPHFFRKLVRDISWQDGVCLGKTMSASTVFFVRWVLDAALLCMGVK